MHQEGHIGLNLLLFAPIAYWLAAHGELLMMGFAMIGVISMAPFPDIDLKLNIKHRGPTHSIWFAILVGLAYAGLATYVGVGDLTIIETAGIGFVSGIAGVVGHILGDMVTPMGVAPFEPITSHWVGLGLCNAGDKRVNRGLMQAGAYTFTIAVALGTVGLSTFIDPFMRILG